jgi:formyl-CoA transferase
MDSEKMAGDLKDEKYNEVWEVITNYSQLIGMLNDPPRLMAMLEKFSHVSGLLKAFLLTKTKLEIFDEAAQRRIMINPVQNAKDIVESPQFKALEFITDVEHPELGMTIKYPGAPYYHISDTPWRISRRAPFLGEHNQEIYEKELGLTRGQLLMLKSQGAI